MALKFRSLFLYSKCSYTRIHFYSPIYNVFCIHVHTLKCALKCSSNLTLHRCLSLHAPRFDKRALTSSSHGHQICNFVRLLSLFFFKKINFIFSYVYTRLSVYGRAYIYAFSSLRSQKRVSDTLRPELEVDVTYLTQVQETRLGYSETTVSNPNG